MKKVALCVVLLLTLSCCLVSSGFAAEKVRLAFVIPSTIDDMAWSQAMYRGLWLSSRNWGKISWKWPISERLWNAVDAGSAIREYAC